MKKYYCSINKRFIERSFWRQYRTIKIGLHVHYFQQLVAFWGERGIFWGVLLIFLRLLCIYSNGFSYYLILPFQCIEITIWFTSKVLISFSSISVSGGSCDLPFTTKIRPKCLCHTRLTSAVINISCCSLIHTQIERIIFPKHYSVFPLDRYQLE